MPRAIVYVDGFNLYYGALKHGPHKWLNIQAYFEELLPHDDVIKIRYFTSMVDPPAAARQLTYLRALSTQARMEIITGKFQKRRTHCLVPGCHYSGPRVFFRREEKQTDVNISVRMMDDVIEDRCDKLVLVTGDSDLVGPVQWIRSHHQTKRVVVYVPTEQHSNEKASRLAKRRTAACDLARAAHSYKLMPLALLRHSQFPPTIVCTDGTRITKPVTW